MDNKTTKHLETQDKNVYEDYYRTNGQQNYKHLRDNMKQKITVIYGQKKGTSLTELQLFGDTGQQYYIDKDKDNTIYIQ